MSKSDYLENIIINLVLRNVGYTPAATVYVALYTAAPSDAGGGTEVSGNAYARVAITFSAASGGSTSNSGTLTFATPTPSGWGTVTHFGIFDASSGGNLLYWNALTASKTINAGDTVTFAAGTLTVSES
jgi:hypothetical protein